MRNKQMLKPQNRRNSLLICGLAFDSQMLWLRLIDHSKFTVGSKHTTNIFCSNYGRRILDESKDWKSFHSRTTEGKCRRVCYHFFLIWSINSSIFCITASLHFPSPFYRRSFIWFLKQFVDQFSHIICHLNDENHTWEYAAAFSDILLASQEK